MTRLQRLVAYHLAHNEAPNLHAVLKHSIMLRGIRYKGYFIVPERDMDSMLSEALKNMLALMSDYRRQQWEARVEWYNAQKKKDYEPHGE